MPSIPQSLLWISLVVLWLFVLVPMLISKRDAVRRTSDVALATRVLNTATGSRLLKRGGPASGHRSDPDWQPSEDDLDDEFDDEYDGADEYEDDVEAPPEGGGRRGGRHRRASCRISTSRSSMNLRAHCPSASPRPRSSPSPTS